MAEPSTLARPYAKAVFELARDEGKLAEWSALLKGLAGAVRDRQVAAAIGHPAVGRGQLAEVLVQAMGKATEQAKNLLRLLSEYEADLERSREMCALLADYALLEPFTMQATPRGGNPLQLTGMHRVAEKKLEELNAAQLKNLMRKGILARIYIHLLSLQNFARLLERRAAA